MFILQYWVGYSKLEKGVPVRTPSNKNYKLNLGWLKPKGVFKISVSENFRAYVASFRYSWIQVSRSIAIGLSSV